MTQNPEFKVLSVPDYDMFDVVRLCYTALAQDSPQAPQFYLNQILNLSFGYLSKEQRKEIEEYLAEKKYLSSDPKIEIVK
tara:strand:+ start:12703 stop:12942 length:240 start_codon:yes stop_codon:yes gene_type:complete